MNTMDAGLDSEYNNVDNDLNMSCCNSNSDFDLIFTDKGDVETAVSDDNDHETSALFVFVSYLANIEELSFTKVVQK